MTPSRNSFVLAALAAAALPGFKTPSGNISCVAVARGTVLHCDIRHADYRAALQRRCGQAAGVDWHGFDLPAARRGLVSCAGGLAYPGRRSYVALGYGRTWRRGAFTCRSRVTGVTCTTRSGHGLFISRGRWRAW